MQKHATSDLTVQNKTGKPLDISLCIRLPISLCEKNLKIIGIF